VSPADRRREQRAARRRRAVDLAMRRSERAGDARATGQPTGERLVQASMVSTGRIPTDS
jgi:hypothetical protein